MVADHSWSTTSSSSVAACEGPVEANSEAESKDWSEETESHDRQRRSPAEVRAMATTKIGRIRAAITSLGPDDTEERASLEAALARAEHLASVPPVDKGIADAEAFVVRAKKRIAAESAKMVKAEKQKHLFEQELAQAETDLIGFRQETEMHWSGSGVPINPVSALEAELSRVRAELAQLREAGQEADLPCGPSVKRVCRTGERVPIPPMPTLVPAELSAWLEERHSELHGKETAPEFWN